MAFQDPDGFDTFRRGEPSVSLLGDQGTVGMDVFRRGEAAESILQSEEPAVELRIYPHLIVSGGVGW